MINLLPPAITDRIHYSRKNLVLLQWLVWVVLANVGLVMVLLFGWIYIDKESTNINSQIAITEKQLKDQNLDQVEKQSKEITNNVKTINQVLSKEVVFSQLIQESAKIIPPNAVLGSISLTQVSGSVDIIINSRDYSSAVQAAANLSDPKNNLFEKVDIVNVNCSNNNAAYACTSTFKALFSKTAEGKFLKTAKDSSR